MFTRRLEKLWECEFGSALMDTRIYPAWRENELKAMVHIRELGDLVTNTLSFPVEISEFIAMFRAKYLYGAPCVFAWVAEDGVAWVNAEHLELDVGGGWDKAGVFEVFIPASQVKYSKVED